MLELTDEEAAGLIVICISARYGLRGAAKKKHELGFHNHAIHTGKLVDLTETLSSRLYDLGVKCELPMFQLGSDGIDRRIDK